MLIAKHGMTCDNVLAAQVVMADGRLVEASERENPDLLWGICGGGGNFGAVTSIAYKLHPVRELLAGTLEYRAEKVADVLRLYRDFAPSAPDDFSANIEFDSPSEREYPLRILCCWCGSLQAGERILAPFRSRFGRIRDRVKKMTYLEAQATSDFPTATRTSMYDRSRFIGELSDDFIAALSRDLPPRGTFGFMIHYHGEVTRRAGANAFPHRRAGFNPFFGALWQGREPNREAIDWVNRMFRVTAPSANGVYVNYLGDEGDARVHAAYGPNYERLVALKKKYDPTNFFRFNQNIKPTT